ALTGPHAAGGLPGRAGGLAARRRVGGAGGGAGGAAAHPGPGRGGAGRPPTGGGVPRHRAGAGAGGGPVGAPAGGRGGGAGGGGICLVLFGVTGLPAWAILALACLAGGGTVFFDSALTVAVRDLYAGDALVGVNTLLETVRQLAVVVGPTVVAVLAVTLGL